MEGKKWQLKGLLTQCQFIVVVHVSCLAGQAILPMPRALAPGKPLSQQHLGSRRAHTFMAPLPDSTSRSKPFQAPKTPRIMDSSLGCPGKGKSKLPVGGPQATNALEYT